MIAAGDIARGFAMAVRDRRTDRRRRAPRTAHVMPPLRRLCAATVISAVYIHITMLTYNKISAHLLRLHVDNGATYDI